MGKRKKRAAQPSRETTPALPVRTIALVGHRGAGKTTLAEAILAAGGAVRQPGRVEEGTALLDHDPEERRRRQTLFNGYGWIEWRDTLLQIIDTPGTQARASERLHAIQAADVVVVVADAGEELPVGGERALIEAERAGLPCFVFVNKVDRPHDLAMLLDGLEVAERPAVCLEAPLSVEGRCAGIADLITGEVSLLDADLDVPSARFTGPFVEALHEAVAVTDDAMIATFLEHNALAPEQLEAGLRTALEQGQFNAVVFGSAIDGFGVAGLLDHVVQRTPDANERRGPLAFEMDGTPVRIQGQGSFVAQLVSAHLDDAGQVWRVLRVFRGEAPLNQEWVNGDTGVRAKVRKVYRLRGARRAAARQRGPGALLATWDPIPGRPGDTFTCGESLMLSQMEPPGRMMTYAFSEAGSVGSGLQTLLELDGGLAVQRVAATRQLLLSGTDEDHLDLMLELMAERLGIHGTPSLPPVIYRECPMASASDVRGEHRVEDGDGLAVEYGACVVAVAPAEVESIDFEDVCTDDEELPRRFRPAIGEGARDACEHGPLAGYPVSCVRIALLGGDYDILQSTPEHFRLAGRAAVERALASAGTRLQEPWWQVDVYVPSTTVGEAITEIAGRRGRVLGMDVLGTETRIVASMPYREMRTFGRGLQGASHGRGRFFGDFSHFEAAPDHLVPEAIASSPFHAVE